VSTLTLIRRMPVLPVPEGWPALGERLAVIVIASGMGPLQPGEPFHPGNRAEDLYRRLAPPSGQLPAGPVVRPVGDHGAQIRAGRSAAVRPAHADPPRGPAGSDRRPAGELPPGDHGHGRRSAQVQAVRGVSASMR
jgi:hypothetical protein